jgi:hypothetical protein
MVGPEGLEPLTLPITEPTSRQMPGAHRAKVEPPEVLLGNGISQHVNQARTIGQKAGPFSFAPHFDLRQLPSGVPSEYSALSRLLANVLDTASRKQL